MDAERLLHALREDLRGFDFEAAALPVEGHDEALAHVRLPGRTEALVRYTPGSPGIQAQLTLPSSQRVRLALIEIRGNVECLGHADDGRAVVGPLDRGDVAPFLMRVSGGR